jgi:hypothetical protein
MRAYHLILLFPLLMLSACDKQRRALIPGLSATDGMPMKATAPKTVLVIGQSNAVYFMTRSQGPQEFERLIQTFAPGPVTYISAAVGGSSIASWAPGTTNFQNAVTAAMGRNIDVIFWDQGEYEAQDGDVSAAESWGQSFTTLINALRSAIGNPNIPVLYCRLTNDTPLPLGNAVYGAQTRVRIHNGVMVPLDGIPTDGGLHYTPENYKRVAERYARAYYEFLSNDAH